MPPLIHASGLLNFFRPSHDAAHHTHNPRFSTILATDDRLNIRYVPRQNLEQAKLTFYSACSKSFPDAWYPSHESAHQAQSPRSQLPEYAKQSQESTTMAPFMTTAYTVHYLFCSKSLHDALHPSFRQTRHSLASHIVLHAMNLVKCLKLHGTQGENMTDIPC